MRRQFALNKVGFAASCCPLTLLFPRAATPQNTLVDLKSKSLQMAAVPMKQQHVLIPHPPEENTEADPVRKSMPSKCGRAPTKAMGKMSCSRLGSHWHPSP